MFMLTTVYDAGGGGGVGQGGHNLPLPVTRSPTSLPFSPFVTRLPPVIVFLPLSYKLKRPEAWV